MAIRIPYLWVDHRPRVEFYVRHGLLDQSPTDTQLAKAFDEMKTQVGILGQLIYYAKNPRMIFPSAAKREFVDNPRVTGDSPAGAKKAAQRVARPNLSCHSAMLSSG